MTYKQEKLIGLKDFVQNLAKLTIIDLLIFVAYRTLLIQLVQAKITNFSNGQKIVASANAVYLCYHTFYATRMATTLKLSVVVIKKLSCV